MGYYVTLIESNASIPADKLDEAYTLLCDLNQRNDLKRGGNGKYAFGRTPEGEEPIEGPHKGVWFSWMDWNYPDTCPTTDAILTQVGYEMYPDENEALIFGSYDNKTGCEGVFVAALAPVLASTDDQPVQFVWRGEDGALWRQVMEDGELVEQKGRVVFS